jgi:hypothetical protein
MANTYVKIASVSVGSGGAANMEFTSIPATYTDLVVKVSSRSSTATFPTGLRISFNGIGGTSYSFRILRGSGSAATSINSSGNDHIQISNTDAVSATASTFDNTEVYIPDYAGATNKSVSSDGVSENNATEAYAQLGAGLFSNTAAINQITLVLAAGNFVQYSTATLYGISKS